MLALLIPLGMMAGAYFLKHRGATAPEPVVDPNAPDASVAVAEQFAPEPAQAYTPTAFAPEVSVSATRLDKFVKPVDTRPNLSAIGRSSLPDTRPNLSVLDRSKLK